MENTGYCSESFTSLQSAASDEDMVEIAGATLDFSSTDDVPPLDRDYRSGKRATEHIEPISVQQSSHGAHCSYKVE